MDSLKRWFHDHSLSLALGAILVAQSLTFFLLTYPDGNGNVQPGMSYWDWAMAEYQLSTLADTYGMLLIVLLSKWFWERGSKEG